MMLALRFVPFLPLLISPVTLACHCSGCNSTTDACTTPYDCDTGYWGPTCESLCQHKHCSGTNACNAHTGDCPVQYDCDTGYWDANCESQCQYAHCSGTNACNGHTGDCPVQYDCDTGYWGANCESQCQHAHCSGTNACDGHTGDCPTPCDCDTGWWTFNCESGCTHAHCSGTNACNGNTGDCPVQYDCDTGYYGPNCESECPHKHCSGTYACNGHTGDCPEPGDCDSGWCGTNCDTKCNNTRNDEEVIQHLKKKSLQSLMQPDKSPTVAQLLLSDNGTCGSGLPSTCMKPQGGNSCDWYSTCLEKAHPCGTSGYVQKFGQPFCEKFLALDKDPSVSAAEKKWMDGVRQCLQEQAVHLAFDGHLSCDDIQKQAFATHSLCYTAPDNNICYQIGIWPDLVKIIGKDLLDPSVLGNEASVAGQCGVSYAKSVGSGIVSGFERLGHATVKFAESASHWMEHASYSLLAGVFHWSSPSGDQYIEEMGPSMGQASQLLTSLGQAYGNLSMACNVSQCVQEFQTDMSKAAATFGQPELWSINDTAIRLKSDPTVAFERLFGLLANSCAGQCYECCGSNATLIAWSSVSGTTMQQLVV